MHYCTRAISGIKRCGQRFGLGHWWIIGPHILIKLTHSAIAGVSDKDSPAGGIAERQICGSVEQRSIRFAVIAAKARLTLTREGDDLAERVHHLPNAMIVLVGDVNVTCFIHRYTSRMIELGRERWPAIAAIA